MGLEAASFIEDLNANNPDGAIDSKNQGDNHIRLIKLALKATFPGMAGRAWRTQTKGGDYTAVATDNMSFLRFSATAVLSLAAAATLGNGWMAVVYPSAGTTTINPNGAETVNGVATYDVTAGKIVVLFCDGSALFAFHLFSAVDLAVAAANTAAAAAAQATADAAKIQLQAAVNLNAVSHDFVIGAGAKRITCRLQNASLGGSGGAIIVKFGTSAGIQSAGYDSLAWIRSSTENLGHVVNSGLVITYPKDGARQYSGLIHIEKQGSADNVWVYNSQVHATGHFEIFSGAGYRDVGGEVTTLRLTSEAGVNAFDLGVAGISVEI